MAELQVRKALAHAHTKTQRCIQICIPSVTFIFSAVVVASWSAANPLPRPYGTCTVGKQRRKITETPLSQNHFPPFALGLLSAVQVFQKCTIKDVGVESSVEPSTRTETQIRELRSGSLLPLKEKKVKHASSYLNHANRLPLPTVWYSRRLWPNKRCNLCTFALGENP